MYLSALRDTKRLVNMFSMVKICENSFEKSHWTGVKPADLHVFLASGCVQGMQVQLIHCVQMYLLGEKPNIWQAAQSHILVEQTHTHTHLSKVHLPLLHSYIYQSSKYFHLHPYQVHWNLPKSSKVVWFIQVPISKISHGRC